MAAVLLLPATPAHSGPGQARTERLHPRAPGPLAVPRTELSSDDVERFTAVAKRMRTTGEQLSLNQGTPSPARAMDMGNEMGTILSEHGFNKENGYLTLMAVTSAFATLKMWEDGNGRNVDAKLQQARE